MAGEGIWDIIRKIREKEKDLSNLELAERTIKLSVEKDIKITQCAGCDDIKTLAGDYIGYNQKASKYIDNNLGEQYLETAKISHDQCPRCLELYEKLEKTY